MCFSLTRYSTCLAVENQETSNHSRNPLKPRRFSDSMTNSFPSFPHSIEKQNRRNYFVQLVHREINMLNQFWKLGLLANFLIPRKFNIAPPQGNFNLGLPPNSIMYLPFTRTPDQLKQPSDLRAYHWFEKLVMSCLLHLSLNLYLLIPKHLAAISLWHSLFTVHCTGLYLRGAG